MKPFCRLRPPLLTLVFGLLFVYHFRPTLKYPSFHDLILNSQNIDFHRCQLYLHTIIYHKRYGSLSTSKIEFGLRSIDFEFGLRSIDFEFGLRSIVDANKRVMW
ncbi:hypothetical protein Hdeb2414_s0027g00685001 [Helianthus debilis subsp. tardiflorus]